MKCQAHAAARAPLSSTVRRHEKAHQHLGPSDDFIAWLCDDRARWVRDAAVPRSGIPNCVLRFLVERRGEFPCDRESSPSSARTRSNAPRFSVPWENDLSKVSRRRTVFRHVRIRSTLARVWMSSWYEWANRDAKWRVEPSWFLEVWGAHC
jgi:hypothetical protein